jgi:hypothetical protein
MLNPPPAGREVLPFLCTTCITPRVPTRIVGRPKNGPLMLERLFLSPAGTPGGTRDWVVNDVEIDGVSQLSVKDLPGTLFSPRGIVAEGKRRMSEIYFSGLDVIECESEAAVTVTYVGPNPEGAPLFAAIVGKPPPQRPTVLPIATKKAVAPTATTTIRAILDAPLKIEMLEILDEGTEGGAGDWIVNDLRVDGTPQFTQSGGIPGDMFSTRAIDSVKCQPGKEIEIAITYIGLKAEGACFVANFLGAVVRDDYDQPPPDVRAIVRVSGEDDFGEEVVARCNWRASYVGDKSK